MRIEMDPELFGLDDVDSAVWASKAQPALSMNDKLFYIGALGSEGMSVHLAEDEDKFAAKFSVWNHGHSAAGGRACFDPRVLRACST